LRHLTHREASIFFAVTLADFADVFSKSHVYYIVHIFLCVKLYK
jgi:hypothetical protein